MAGWTLLAVHFEVPVLPSIQLTYFSLVDTHNLD